MNDEIDPAQMPDSELAVAIKRYRSAALRRSGYLAQRGDELEKELRRRAGIVSAYGAPLQFVSSRKRPWWQFW